MTHHNPNQPPPPPEFEPLPHDDLSAQGNSQPAKPPQPPMPQPTPPPPMQTQPAHSQATQPTPAQSPPAQPMSAGAPQPPPGSPQPPVQGASSPHIESGGGGGGLNCWGCLLATMGVMLALTVGLVLFIAVVVSNVGDTTGNFFDTLRAFFSPGQRQITGIQLPEIERIQLLSDLTTTRFNYAQIVTASTDMPEPFATLYGDNLVMVAVGHIEAGIDLGALTADDVTLNESDNIVTLRLPAPVIQDCFLDEQQSYTVSRTTGVFASPSPALDSQARRYALNQFRDTAMEEGILREAQQEAENVLREFLVLLNDPEQTLTIQFEFDPIDPNAPLPATCGSG